MLWGCCGKRGGETYMLSTGSGQSATPTCQFISCCLYPSLYISLLYLLVLFFIPKSEGTEGLYNYLSLPCCHFLGFDNNDVSGPLILHPLYRCWQKYLYILLLEVSPLQFIHPSPPTLLPSSSTICRSMERTSWNIISQFESPTLVIVSSQTKLDSPWWSVISTW